MNTKSIVLGYKGNLQSLQKDFKKYYKDELKKLGRKTDRSENIFDMHKGKPYHTKTKNLVEIEEDLELGFFVDHPKNFRHYSVSMVDGLTDLIPEHLEVKDDFYYKNIEES